MHCRMKALPLTLAQALQFIAAVSCTVAVASTMAQEAPGDSQPVQRVEITGSNIRRADAETPSPVQVITAEDL